VSVPFPLPLIGNTLNQETLSATVQLVFEVTLKVVVPAGAVTFCVAGSTDSVAPAWITVTITSGTPAAEMVIFAERLLAEVFWSKVTVIVALLLPDAVFTENQAELSATVHARFEVMLKVVVPAGGFTFSESGAAES
jgi:hypothetical protein